MWVAGTPSEDFARRIVEERARPALGEEAWARARAKGAELPLADVLALVCAPPA
jgi:hypothetical protein